MSHILDALQKVQEQKVVKLKHQTITGGALIDSSVRCKNQKRWYLTGTAIVLLSVTVFGAWHFLKPANKPIKTEAKELVSLPKPLIQAVVPPAPVQPAAPVSTSDKSIQNGLSIQKNQNDKIKEKNQTVKKTVSVGPTKTPKVTAQTRPATQIISSAPEGIKLTGIAWQEDRKLRRAVVNDILIGEKDEIAGAKAVEIRPDLVRFEKNGLFYDVVLPR